MKYKKGDRILFNRLMFGTVYQDQISDSVVNVTFDREQNVIQGVRSDLIELVADAQHEANLALLISTPQEPTGGNLAGEILKIAEELSFGADHEKNIFRLRTTMKNASLRLRGIAEDM